MNLDGSHVQRITNSEERDDYPAWHSAGKQLVTVSERDGEFDLYLYDVEPTQLAAQNSGASVDVISKP
jgi:Tol biopolymer transport system component